MLRKIIIYQTCNFQKKEDKSSRNNRIMSKTNVDKRKLPHEVSVLAQWHRRNGQKEVIASCESERLHPLTFIQGRRTSKIRTSGVPPQAHVEKLMSAVTYK